MTNKFIKIALDYYGQNWNNPLYPWCAEFINDILIKNGIKGTNSLLARSFLSLGEHTDTPELGDIVVLWRESQESIYGHAGFYISENENSFFLLGGNQDGIVKIKSYPKWMLLDIRRITEPGCSA